MICAFIDEQKHRFGVAQICRALTGHGIPIAPRTYWARLSAAPSKRALWDTAVTEILAGIYEPDQGGRRPPECLYGTVKMWAHLNRQGIPVAKSTVERLKRAHGWRGVTRGRRVHWYNTSRLMHRLGRRPPAEAEAAYWAAPAGPPPGVKDG